MPQHRGTAALERWEALPPGAARDRAAPELLAALRVLPDEDARRLVADIYRVVREQETAEHVEGRDGS